MGSSPAPKDSLVVPAKAPAAPEALARVVLRCRELSAFLDDVRQRLPSRSETPFLYGQLEDVLQRLQASLQPYTDQETSPGQRTSFLRRITGMRRPRRSEPRYDLQGNAWTIPVTELVGFLAQSGKSGLLWITGTSETFVLEFASGSLIHATSSAPPQAFRLGEILLTEKLLEPAELAQVIEHAKAADDLLGGYLLRTGRLSHSDLQRALTRQVQELFHRLMDAENALYRFQEGAQLLRSQSLEVNITHLLLESARKKDEARMAAEREKDGASAGVAGLESVFGRDDDPLANAPPRERRATGEETAAKQRDEDDRTLAAALPGERKDAADGDEDRVASEGEEQPAGERDRRS